MKSHILIPLAAVLAAVLAGPAAAQNRIWRCPNNAFTNDAAEASARGCKPFEGGNVTVIEGTRVNGSARGAASAARPAAAAPVAPVAAPRIDTPEQRARDADARMILDAELKKAETRRAELLKEYNNGEPEKLGPETRNHQKYLDRVAELKANIARTENDIAGLKRELARFGGANGTGTAGAPPAR